MGQRAGKIPQNGSKEQKVSKNNTEEVPVLSKEDPKKFILIQKNTLISGEGLLPVIQFRFEIPNNKPLGLPVGQHIFVCAEIDGNDYMRAYTPTTSNIDLGYFELTVKIYPKGIIGNYLSNLKIGDSVEIMGPRGEFTYEKNKYNHLGMLTGGTGIAPMMQIIDEISRHPDDTTKISLLYGNLSDKDIIFKEKLDEYVKKCPNITVYHVLNNPPEGWQQGKGFITQEMIEKMCPKVGEGKMLLCGPPPMIKAMQTLLQTTMGYKPEEVFYF